MDGMILSFMLLPQLMIMHTSRYIFQQNIAK